MARREITARAGSRNFVQVPVPRSESDPRSDNTSQHDSPETVMEPVDGALETARPVP